MRLAPVALAFARDPLTAISLYGESSRTTHGAQDSVDACRYFGALGIPEHWSDQIVLRQRIIELADGLLALAG